ncbi:MAG: DUF3108 domain-containing protein [Archangium sp.]
MRSLVLLPLISTLALAGPGAVVPVPAPAPAPAPAPTLRPGLATLKKLPPPPAPAPAPVQKPLSPFPTDAECVALGSPIAPVPFTPGETLDFDVDALGARAASMTMQVLPLRDGVMPLEVSVETNTFFSKVRRVKGVGKSYLNPKTLRPVRYFEEAQENEIHRVADVSFKKNAARLVSDITWPAEGGNGKEQKNHWEGDLRFGNDVADVAGVVHLLRSMPMKEGTKLCVDVYGIRAIWRVWGTIKPREHVSIPLGEFETWHLAGEAARLDIPNQRREVHVWVTDDARRLPLAALGMIDLGAVRATLKAYSRPGEKSVRAQSKADIKW